VGVHVNIILGKDDEDEKPPVVAEDWVTAVKLGRTIGVDNGKDIEFHQSNSLTLCVSIPAETSSVLTPSGTRKCMGRVGSDPTYRDTSASRSKWS
jgi:hypothetical protein